jgi:predicted ATPase
MAEQSRPRVGNLPAEITSFVGRRHELAQGERLLAKSRLVTLTGTGGVGKTRIALRLAALAKPNHPDGVWLAELSALQDVDLLTHTIAEALGMADQSLRPQVDVLADHLADRDLLLVLDTCEHLAAACAELATTLLRAAPRLRILATSRRPLGTPGEHTLIVPPLPLTSAARYPAEPAPTEPTLDHLDPAPHESPNHIDPDDSMMLFAERAAAVDPNFTLTPQNRPAVARLCRGLDGIPLAIELAAVRLRVLSLEQISERLDHRFRLLVGADRSDEPRHSSLRTAIGWSHELCEPAERLLWARSSVFAGDFDLTAAEYVCADDQLPASNLVNLMTGLVEKSVLAREQCHGKVRFRLLDTLREYGEEWSTALGERPVLLRRHRDYYLRLARRSEAECMGANQFGLRDRMTLEHANIRAALDFCLAEPEGRHGLELAGALWFYWDCCGFLQDGRYYLERLLDMDPEPSPERAKALWVCGAVVGSMGDTDRACVLAADCVDLTEHGDQVELLETKASALYVTAHAMALTGDPVQAVSFATAAVDLQRRTGRPGLPLFKGLVMGAFALIVQGKLIEALSLLDELSAECAEHGEMWARAYGEYLRGFVDLARGEPRSAITCGRAALRVKRRMHDTLGTAASIDLLAAAAAADGDSERASVLLGLGDQVWSALGLPQLGSPALIAVRDRCERQSREALGDRAYEAAFRRGARIDLNLGISYAMGDGVCASNDTDFAAITHPVTHVP